MLTPASFNNAFKLTKFDFQEKAVPFEGIIDFHAKVVRLRILQLNFKLG